MSGTYIVVVTDNYGRETISEKVLCAGSKETMNKICELLRNDPLRPDANWYKVEAWNYKPYKWEP